MNINNIFSAKISFLIGLVIVIFLIFTYHFSLKEGQTSGCDPVSNVQENPNDTKIGSLISGHVATAISTLDSYLPQLRAIQDKFRNISSCLKIGTINISSENSFPVVTIDDPEPGTINQKINYILPQGQKGPKGYIGPYTGPTGVWGNKGKNGNRGPVGENIIPKNINNNVY